MGVVTVGIGRRMGMGLVGQWVLLECCAVVHADVSREAGPSSRSKVSTTCCPTELHSALHSMHHTLQFFAACILAAEMYTHQSANKVALRVSHATLEM